MTKPKTVSGQPQSATATRSVVKAVTYRVIIICLDFTAIYLMTGKIRVALGFMIVSNLYTTVGYFLHERVWSRIAWGRLDARARILTNPRLPTKSRTGAPLAASGPSMPPTQGEKDYANNF